MDAIFANVGQAVHVAFLVMSQPAMQQAPFRKALIRAMESIKLEGYQREWLDQLRGAPSDDVNFGGLTGEEVRAQCVLIKQAVAHLPDAERWTLEAKYGYIEFEIATPGEIEARNVANALARANAEVIIGRNALRLAREELEAARTSYQQVRGRIASPDVEDSAHYRYEAARGSVKDVSVAVHAAEATARQIQIIVDSAKGVNILSGSRPPAKGEERRFAFSAERSAAIQGLSNWMRPIFPDISPWALDCLLGRVMLPRPSKNQHSQQKASITLRGLAESFGGNPMTYQRATTKMQGHLRQLEEKAIERLSLRLIHDGIAVAKECA